MEIKQTIKLSIDLAKMPVSLGARTIKSIGEAAMVEATDKLPLQRLGYALLRLSDNNMLVKERRANKIRDEKQTIRTEIVERPHDYALVDTNVRRYVTLGLREAGDRFSELRARLSHEPHLEEIVKFMESSGALDPATIEIAAAKVLEQPPEAPVDIIMDFSEPDKTPPVSV